MTGRSLGELGFAVDTRGRVGEGDRAALAAAVRAVLDRHHQGGPVRLRLTGPSDPDGPVVVQINLSVRGRPARVEVPGPTADEAIQSAASRLNRQLTRLTGVWQVWPWPDPQRDPLGRPDPSPVTRHKSCRPEVRDPGQAAWVLGAMDYDAHLFTDRETGEDAVVYRAGPAGVRLARQRSMHPPADGAPMTVSPHHVPVLRTAEALRWLAEGWLQFLFYTDGESGRGRLLYRRYDRGLGLITAGGCLR
jgi:hypothetical protein